MRNRNLLTLGSALLALALAAPASAGTLYRYTAADGSVAFTDDPKRIPEGRRDDAQSIATGGLDVYERYTPTVSEEPTYAQRLEARLERLRALNREAPAPQPAPDAGPSTILRVDEHTSLAIPNGSGGDGRGERQPVVVEERRVRDANSLTTQHVTVVRQGDQVLSVIKPRSSVGTTHPPKLEEFVD